jgi:hypothetical protein
MRTPGPWWMGIEESPADGHFYLIFGPSRDPVLKIEPLAQVMYAEEADVRLMSAAPELLAALKELAEDAAKTPADQKSQGLQRKVNDAFIAIAKAEGR